MSRPFTQKHRDKHALPKDHPNFHGFEAETLYLDIMMLLTEFHYLSSVIRAKREQGSVKRLNMLVTKKPRALTKHWLAQKELAESEPRPVQELSRCAAEAQALIAQKRKRYTKLHMLRHYRYLLQPGK